MIVIYDPPQEDTPTDACAAPCSCDTIPITGEQWDAIQRNALALAKVARAILGYAPLVSDPNHPSVPPP